MTAGIRPTVAFAVALWFIGKSDAAQYLGKFLGKLSELHHGVSGEVYAVDGRTLYIKDFTYDGQGPAAYFYASMHKGADKNGFRLRDENGKGDVIRRYRKEGVTLTLPEGKSLNNIKIFYVWCEEFDVNFGDVKIPRNYDYPRPQKIDALKGVHAISSDNIVIVDAQTLLIPNLSYDGEAPDAKFWVGPGSKPSPQGIRVPDENGKEVPLRRYDRKTVVLTLPGDLTVFDIGHFGIWCEQFTVDFGHVLIPEGLNIPPSLKMLGVSPQKLQQQVDITSKVSNARPVVGGHLQPTTFRPPHFFSIFNRRSDDGLASTQQPNSVQYNPFHQGYHQQVFPQQVAAQQLVPESRVYDPQVIQQQTIRELQPEIQQQQQQQQQQLIYQAKPQLTYLPQFINQQQPVPQLQQVQNAQPVHTQIVPPAQLIHQQYNQISRAQSRQFQLPQINYNQQTPIGYAPLNLNQRQYQEHLAQNQYLQAQKLQEEQLKAQLSRQHNRFDLTGHQNAYVQLG